MLKPSHPKRPFLVALVGIGLSLLYAADALAYFDPASGSLVLQMILGGIAGVALMVRIYWHKVLGLFGVRTPDPRQDDDSEDLEDEDQDEGDADDGDDEDRQ